MTANRRRGVPPPCLLLYCAPVIRVMRSEDQFDEVYEYSCSRYFELRHHRTSLRRPSLRTDLRIRPTQEIETQQRARRTGTDTALRYGLGLGAAAERRIR